MFADGGYDHTSLRAIAKDAGVDSALVMHYFVSKEGLFRAAIEWPFDMDEKVATLFGGDPQHVGERLVRMVCEVWEDEPTRHPLAVVLRNAMQQDEAARLAAQFIQKEMIEHFVAQFQSPQAALRASLAQSAIMGLVVARYLMRVEPLASLSSEQVVAVVGPAIQWYLTGDMGPGNGPQART